MMLMLAYLFQLRHTLAVPDTDGTEFGSSNDPRRTIRRNGGIFSSTLCAPLWGAVAGGFGLPVPLDAGLPTRHVPPTTRLEAGERLNCPRSADMANLALRTSAHHQYPSTRTEAEHAARMWFIPRNPGMTLATWRDHFRDLHLAGIRCDDWLERLERTEVWNAAFCDGVAAEIAGGARHG